MPLVSLFNPRSTRPTQLRLLITALCLNPIFLYTAAAAETPGAAKQSTALSLEDLKLFELQDGRIPRSRLDSIAEAIKEETGLERPRPMPAGMKRRINKAFDHGSAGGYSVQDLIDAGVFRFKPILNLHPSAAGSDEDKSVCKRDGSDIEVENSVWGKRDVPAILTFGVMHSTEDGLAGAADTIDIWNKDASEGKRSSSTPFVLGRGLKGREIYVTADFVSRWQRHCSSKLTSRPGVVNWSSVGVEMEHSSEKNINYTNEEIKNAARLWTYIQQKAAIPDNKLITHAELQGHLPREHKSFRSDPEGFDWKKFGEEMRHLRKVADYSPPPSDMSLPKTLPQKALESGSN